MISFPPASLVFNDGLHIPHQDSPSRIQDKRRIPLLAIMRISPLLITPFAIVLAVPTALYSRDTKPIYWLLAGDSTTATNGGWGDAFLSTTVANGSSGHNYGHSGATTKSFRAGGDWANVTRDIGAYKQDYNVYVTIQVGSFSDFNTKSGG